MDDDTIPSPVIDAFGLVGATISPMEGGRNNRHWRVIGPGSRGSVVLRRYHVWRSRDSIAWEQALVTEAARRGWPTAVPLPALDGAEIVENDGRLWALAPFLSGAPPPPDSVAMRRVMGRLLGRLHHDLESAMEPGQRPGSGKAWELDIATECGSGLSFNALLAAFGREHADLAAVVRRHRYRNLRELARLYYQDLPERPVHGDFAPGNLLFLDGRLTGVLDFDQARLDALACDLAPLLLPFKPLDPPLTRALIDGYQGIRPLSDGEWAILPALVRSAGLSWLAFLLVEWHLRRDERTVAAIARTATERIPAADIFDRLVPALRREIGVT